MSEKSRRAWRHNALLGCVSMMMRQARTISMADTCTEEARRLASEIESKLIDLSLALKERVDPQ